MSNNVKFFETPCIMLKRKSAVAGYTKKSRVWVEIERGAKNRKRGFNMRLVGV